MILKIIVIAVNRVQMCEELNDPLFGTVSYSGMEPGTVAEYSCNPGYLLSGDRTRTCLDPGMWSGNEPTCEREYVHTLSFLPFIIAERFVQVRGSHGEKRWK